MKIRTIQELADFAEKERAKGRRVVQCHGVYDLLHLGHVRHFEAARREGDVLVVTVTPDRFVNKGPGRPVFNEQLRAEMIAALTSVDAVAITENPTAVESIRRVRPDVFVKGSEYSDPSNDVTGKIGEEVSAVEEGGGRVHFTGDLTFSSSQLINAHFQPFTPAASDFLRSFRQRHSADAVVGQLKALSKLRVLVIGDAIIDEYVFCRPYGMASKTAAIAAQYLGMEAYAGGSLAIANHLAGFCGSVDLITSLGANDSREAFIRDKLKPAVNPLFYTRSDGPTTVKRRYVSNFLATKMFEVAAFNDSPLDEETSAAIADRLEKSLSGYDLVVIGDFGHGLMTEPIRRAISSGKAFVALNAQLNSANVGFNFVTKYARCDYVCIDEEEARMAARDRHGDLEEIIRTLSAQLHARLMTVTRGSKGSLTFDPSSNTFTAVPIFSSEVVDTIGAGDAYLSVSAACAVMEYPAETVAFVGNAVGALAVKIMGNRESVEFAPLAKFVGTLLK